MFHCPKNVSTKTPNPVIVVSLGLLYTEETTPQAAAVIPREVITLEAKEGLNSSFSFLIRS